MHKVEPQVFLLGETTLHHPSIKEWLTSLQGEKCLEHIAGTDLEKIIEFAGRRCYKSFDTGLNPNVSQIRKDSEQYHKNILQSQHGSVLEHCNTLWAFENISRVLTHELVRNRLAGISQESLRYVRLTDLGVWLPPEIENNAEAVKIFEETFQYLENQQRRLASLYKIDQITDFSHKKKLTSAFRRIAPIGLATGMVWSANLRSLRWVIEQRTSEHAEVEIRIVFNKVAEIASEKWPMVFQDFRKIEKDGLYHWIPTNHKI